MDPTILLANELFEDEENIFDSFAMLYNNSSHLGLGNSNVQDSVGSIPAATNQVQITESYENPVVPPLELDVPNPLSQFPFASDPIGNGTLQDVVGLFSEGAASSIQDQHMASTGSYNPFYQSQTQNWHMFQGSDVPNEYTTNNQLLEPNFTASNAFNAINQHSFSQTPLFLQDPVEAAGAGIGTGISSGQFMSNQSSMFSPLQNDHLISHPSVGNTSAQHSQFSAVNGYDTQYAPNYMQYDSQYAPNYMQYDSYASYRPPQMFTTIPLHEARRPSEMQMAFDSQSQQFMQPICPSNPRHTYPNHPHSQQFATPYNSFASESSVPPRTGRAMGPPIQQGAPISGNTVTGQRDKGILQSPSFGAQPSEPVLNMLIQNQFPIPASGPSITLGRNNQSLNLQNSMLQRGASIAENAYPVPTSQEADYDIDPSDIIKNTVYSSKYQEIGLPLDPHLRSFLASQENSNPPYFLQ